MGVKDPEQVRGRVLTSGWLLSCQSFRVSVSPFGKVHLDDRLLTFTPLLQKLSARQRSCVL